MEVERTNLPLGAKAEVPFGKNHEMRTAVCSGKLSRVRRSKCRRREFVVVDIAQGNLDVAERKSNSEFL